MRSGAWRSRCHQWWHRQSPTRRRYCADLRRGASGLSVSVSVPRFWRAYCTFALVTALYPFARQLLRTTLAPRLGIARGEDACRAISRLRSGFKFRSVGPAVLKGGNGEGNVAANGHSRQGSDKIHWKEDYMVLLMSDKSAKHKRSVGIKKNDWVRKSPCVAYWKGGCRAALYT